MRFGLIVTLLILLVAPVQAQDDDLTCEVGDIYAEAISEYQLTLFNVLQMTFDTRAPLGDPAVAGAYYETLLSMRQNLETSDLPDCARTLNADHIAAISAAQDVLALMQFENSSLDEARLDFRQRWTELVESAQANPLS